MACLQAADMPQGLLVILVPNYLAVATDPWKPTEWQAFGIKVGLFCWRQVCGDGPRRWPLWWW